MYLMDIFSLLILAFVLIGAAGMVIGGLVFAVAAASMEGNLQRPIDPALKAPKTL